MLGRIFIVIGSLLVLVLFTALIAPYFVDWTDFRHNFEQQASRIIGKKVVVHGRVDARLLPFPSVTMTDVRVGETADGNAIVTARSFSMETELAPYLSGEALIYNMRIDQPRVMLHLAADGTLDWVRTGSPQIPASTVVLENVTISNGEVTFVDDQTKRTRKLDNLNVQLAAKTLAGPWRANGSGRLDGYEGNFVVNTSMPEKDQVFAKLRLLPEKIDVVAELEGSVRLNRLRPEYKGAFRLRQRYRSETASEEGQQDNNAASAARVNGDFELTNDRLRIPKYQFSIGPASDPYTVTGEATIDAGLKPEFLLTAEGQQIDMSRFGGSSEGDTKNTAIPVKDRIDALMSLAGDIPVPQLPGKADISLPAIVMNDTVIRDVALKMRPAGKGWLIDRAEAQLPGRTTLSAKGALVLSDAKSFKGSILLASNQPSGFAEWVTGKIPPSIRQLKTAGFAADVDLTPSLQRYRNLEIIFGASHLKGSMEQQAIDGEAQTLSTDLKGDTLDLDALLALAGLLTGEEDPAAILARRLSARLDIANFRAFGLNGKNAKAILQLADGGMPEAKLSIGDFYGTSLSFAGSLDSISGNPRGKGRLNIRAADPAGVLSLLANRLPHHPVLDRLAQNASYFEDGDLGLDLSLGEGDWPIEATLTGHAHGTKISGKLAAQTLDLSNSGGLTLDLTAENPDAWVMLGQFGLSTIPLDADQDGVIELKLEQPADGDSQLDLKFSSGSTTVSLNGEIALDASAFLNGSYTLAVESKDLSPYLALNGYSLPQMTEGMPVSLKTNIYAAPEAISFESITGQADDNDFSGTISIDRKDGAGRIGGELSIDHADLQWMAENVLGPIAGPVGGLSTVTIPKAGGGLPDANIALNARQFTIGSLGLIDDFSSDVKTEQGRISLSHGRGTFAGGTFGGEAEFGNTGGNGYLRARLKVVDAKLKTMFWQASGQPVATGQADLSFAVDSTGTSAKSMLDSATGSGMLSLRDAKISGIEQQAFASILADADAIRNDITDDVVAPIIANRVLGGATEFAALDVPFVITGTKLRADKVAAKGTQMSIDAEGSMSLDQGSLDASVELHYDPGEQAMAGADPVVQMAFSGPFAEPQRTVDVTQFTSYLSLRRFEQERRRVEILQAKMQEKQRLRREAAKYKAIYAERERIRQKALDDARLLKLEQEALKALAIKEEEQRRNAAGQQDLQQPVLPQP